MSNDLVTGLEKWWKGLTEPPANPMQDKLDELEARLRAQEEKEEGTEKGETGETGETGKEGKEGEGGSGEAGGEGQEGSNGEVGPEGTAEPFTQEIDSEGKVTNKVVTKKKLKEEIEKEGFSTGGAKVGETTGAGVTNHTFKEGSEKVVIVAANALKNRLVVLAIAATVLKEKQNAAVALNLSSKAEELQHVQQEGIAYSAPGPAVTSKNYSTYTVIVKKGELIEGEGQAISPLCEVVVQGYEVDLGS